MLTSEHSQPVGSGDGNGDGESGPEEGCGDGEGSSEADGEGIDGNTSNVGLQLTAQSRHHSAGNTSNVGLQLTAQWASRHHSVSACTPHTPSQLPAVGTSATMPPVSGPWYCSPCHSVTVAVDGCSPPPAPLTHTCIRTAGEREGGEREVGWRPRRRRWRWRGRAHQVVAPSVVCEHEVEQVRTAAQVDGHRVFSTPTPRAAGRDELCTIDGERGGVRLTYREDEGVVALEPHRDKAAQDRREVVARLEALEVGFVLTAAAEAEPWDVHRVSGRHAVEGRQRAAVDARSEELDAHIVGERRRRWRQRQPRPAVGTVGACGAGHGFGLGHAVWARLERTGAKGLGWGLEPA